MKYLKKKFKKNLGRNINLKYYDYRDGIIYRNINFFDFY